VNYSPPRPRAPATWTVSVESRASWTVAVVALLTMAVSFGAPWVAVVALKTIAADAGGARSIPALAGALGWVGVGFGGVLMGWVAGRIEMRATIMFGAAIICAGLAISSLGGSCNSSSGTACSSACWATAASTRRFTCM
jgi:MFS family permease